MTDSNHDLPNFMQVSSHLYRGGQPTSRGFETLRELGVRTVINLRDERSLIHQESTIVGELGLSYLSIPLCPFQEAPEDVINLFLQAVMEESNQPAFVHCWHGMDRTGAMVSIYRLHANQWNLDRAYAEMLSMGFHPEFHRLRQSVVKFSQRIKQG